MFSVLLFFCLAALQLSGPAICNPVQQELPFPGATTGLSGTHRGTQMTVSFYRYFLEMRISGNTRKTVHHSSQRLKSLKKPTTDCVSILNIENGRFLCMDSNGKKYKSGDGKSEDCLFRHVQGGKLHNTFLSCQDGRLLNLRETGNAQRETGNAQRETGNAQRETGNAQRETGNAQTDTLDPQEKSPLVLIKRHAGSPRSPRERPRRSQQVDPSDPFGSENPELRGTVEQTLDQEQEPERGDQDLASAVSKETITSCDDPLQVVLSKSPVSPVLEKEMNDEVQNTE